MQKRTTPPPKAGHNGLEEIWRSIIALFLHYDHTILFRWNLLKLNVKFIYSEKATKFSEIFPLLFTTEHTVKRKGDILQNFVAFSEYMN